MWHIIAVSREIDYLTQEEDITHLCAETEDALLILFQEFCQDESDCQEWDVLKEAIEDGYFVKGPFQS